MNTPPDFFSSIANKIPSPFVGEIHNRITLLLNHILQQEPQAMQRLARQQGRTVTFIWQSFTLTLAATPVGLLESIPLHPKSDLQLEILDKNPANIGKKILQGQNPQIRIEGDVQLAAEVQWLMQNVRWDIAADLARLIGNVPAHYLTSAVQFLHTQLKQWLAKT